MALFNKFFQSHRRKNDQTSDSSDRHTSTPRQQESLFPFSHDQVRIVLFRECDWTGRRLLFDSNAIRKVNVSQAAKENHHSNNAANICTDKLSGGSSPSSHFIEVSDGYGYTYDASCVDSNGIGEMIFGSIAMSFRGTSLKVHWLSEPKRIMCSQVFLSPSHPRANSSSCGGNASATTTNGGSQSTNMSNCDRPIIKTNKSFVASNKSSNPLDVPLSSSPSTATTIDENGRAYSHCDSGFSGTDAWMSSDSQSSSYWPQSPRSSIASVFSNDHGSRSSGRKLSVDSAILVDAAMNGRSSDGCMQRRILRNMSTSFENQLANNDFIGFFADHRNFASTPRTATARRFSDLTGESRSNPEMVRKRKNSSKDSLRLPPPHFSSYTTTKAKSATTSRRSKIGLAVCITFSDSSEDEMQLFCSEHIALLESMLYRLRTAAESAYVKHKKFHQVMLHAWVSATAWITDLFTAPRLIEPVWLTLSTGRSEKPNSLAKNFMIELCWLLNCADTKDTNFFVSTLLTAILTNHLGWVGTVAPIAKDVSTTHANAAAAVIQSQAKMTEISKFHPYNVLWAQLGDLYGSIGHPSKLSKTIVCGTHSATVRKVLNVLTYFIRCGEIKRHSSTKIIERDTIDEIVSGSAAKPSTIVDTSASEVKPKGLSRVKTVKNLSAASTDCATKMVGDDIPTVQRAQEPYAGYSEMVTAIEMDSAQTSSNSKIKLLITSPENDRFECEAAAEAIDYVLKKVDEDVPLMVDELTKANSSDYCDNSGSNRPLKRLWNIATVEEGIRVDQWSRFSQVNTNIPKTDADRNSGTELKRSKSLNNKSNGKIKRATHQNQIEATRTPLARIASLSDLKTVNGTIASDRMQWNVEPIKEVVRHGGDIPFEVVQKRAESEHNLKPPPVSNSVVFVLGDNEVLSGLKSTSVSPVPPELQKIDPKPVDEAPNGDGAKAIEPVSDTKSASSIATCPTDATIASSSASGSGGASSVDSSRITAKKHCTHKKHSGVKFNFEQYPQIVTNYMKNKNLDLSSYDFLEKGLKLEETFPLNFGATSTAHLLPIIPPEEIEQEEEEQCECCAVFRVLQTPSNATELEFNIEDNTYPVPSIKAKSAEGNSTTPNRSGELKPQTMIKEAEVEKAPVETEPKAMDLVRLPIPKTTTKNDKNRLMSQKIGPGFVPSLFIGITDHYIADMVLQGTTASPSVWEPILKKNLALASHCAAFEQMPTENIAIIANVDKWDVKLISSQSFALASGNGVVGAAGSVGMSQLVSTMLETVHVMWSAGTSSKQCMSFMESKLQEMYLQSETLAAFLLATEFCSLNAVTSALNLSANDVPLLLSVASIHSPQVTKKYGISFR